MSKFHKKFREELLRFLFVFLFFYINFNVINFIQSLLISSSKYFAPYSQLELFVAALIVGKVILVIDHIPFVNAFDKGPLIYCVLWKTFWYSAFTLVARGVFRFIPMYSDFHDMHLAWEFFKNQFDLHLFLSLQILYCALFTVYVTFKEFMMAVGVKKTLHLFLKRK